MKKYTPDFIRFGSLKSQKHICVSDTDNYSFHTPPVCEGIYAFPRGFIEGFLIGGAGYGSLQNGRYRKFKDKNGKPIEIKGSDFENFKDRYPKRIQKRLRLSAPEYGDWCKDEDYQDYVNKRTWIILLENEPTHFTYTGLIWHHLHIPEKLKDKILDEKGCWTLVDMKTYLQCLEHQVGRDKWTSWVNLWHEYRVEKSGKKKLIMPPGFNYGGWDAMYSKDHFEVYIENIQNEHKKIS